LKKVIDERSQCLQELEKKLKEKFENLKASVNKLQSSENMTMKRRKEIFQ